MVKAIVGANWGDEGKGKITDMLAEESDIIVRFQGGANAGHTIINDYGKFALHLLPSGVFYNHTTSVIGNGVALNIPYLVKELKSLTDRNVPMPKILVSDRAQILMPYHVAFDTYEKQDLLVNHLVLPSQVLLHSIQISMLRLVSRLMNYLETSRNLRKRLPMYAH